MCRQNRLKPAGMKLTCKTYDRYRPPLAGNLSPCIFSYKPHSLPSVNNLLPGLTGQACDNFSSRRLRRRPQHYWFPTFRFLFLFSFYFFCSLFFLFFLLLSVFFAFFHILYHPIYRIFIFPYFFCGFPQKTASITGCCKISCAVFFWRFYTKDFMHINIEITNTQQRKE